jgi:Zn-dependent protease with chaperone function
MLRVDAPELVVATTDGAVLEREGLDRVVVSEPFEHAPRLIGLPGGTTLEVLDADGSFEGELAAAGIRLPVAVRLQRRWPAVLIAAAALVGLLAAGYFHVLPVAARWAAFAMPANLEARIGDELLATLDRHFFHESRLDASQRARLSDRFARAAAATAPGVRYRLEYRTTGKKLDVNAMALPGGVIVLLDGLVGFTGDEDGVLGVLGHELGHVVHKHSTRTLFQSLGVGIVASLLWGDFSGAAASAPAVIGLLRYSRDFERDADEFAIGFLRSNGLPVRPLYRFFVKLRELESRLGMEGVPDFLSTHPSTEDRLRRLWLEPD